MRRAAAVSAPLIPLLLWVVSTTAIAQPQVVIDVCSGTTPSPVFGDNGVAMVQDIIDIGTDEPIEDTQVVMEITHTFVGDLNLTLTSPDLVTVTLHAGGGGATDDIGLIYDDAGVVNGSPYDCSCVMQPSGPGAMADFSSTSSVGSWTLDVEDTFPSSGGGTLDSWCVRILNEAQSQFIRGDVNGDGTFNGLVDGVAALNYQFTPGSTPPPCMKAADADDNGTFNGLIDGAVCLNFQFVPGSPPPPPPYPGCGPDPTTEDPELSCELPPIGCM